MRLSMAALVLTTAALWASEHTKDTSAQVKRAVAEKKAVLVDIREAKEWDAGHLKDASLLPLSRLKAGVSADELAETLPKGKVVYLHCKSGGRCLVAAELLARQGYDARPLEQGYEVLLTAGFERAK